MVDEGTVEEWESIDTLIGTVNKVHGLEIVWEGKKLTIFYKYLTDSDVPDASARIMAIPKELTTDERNIRVLNILSEEMSYAMIDKAQREHPDMIKLKITHDQFLRFDPMLRSLIANNITNAQNTTINRF